MLLYWLEQLSCEQTGDLSDVFEYTLLPTFLIGFIHESFT